MSASLFKIYRCLLIARVAWRGYAGATNHGNGDVSVSFRHGVSLIEVWVKGAPPNDFLPTRLEWSYIVRALGSRTGTIVGDIISRLSRP